MDKTINYSIVDLIDENINISIKVTTIGFPVVETLEFYNQDEWITDINDVKKDFNDHLTVGLWENFKQRVLTLLDNSNMRVVMDLMNKNDEYYCRLYELKIVVDDLEIVDNYMG